MYEATPGYYKRFASGAYVDGERVFSFSSKSDKDEKMYLERPIPISTREHDIPWTIEAF